MAESQRRRYIMCIAPVRSGSYGRRSRHRCLAMRPMYRGAGGRPARWSASFRNDRSGCRRWWAGIVARPPSVQVSSVVRPSGRRPPSSKCIFHHHYVCPSVPTQNERDGLAGWGRRRTRRLAYMCAVCVAM